jgi:hypothetical protein
VHRGGPRGHGYTAVAMGEGPDLGRQVYNALGDLHDPAALQTNPLAALVRKARGPTLTPQSAGRLLRQGLLDAVAALKPGAGTLGAHRTGRAHELLQLRYVEGLEPEAIQTRLGISKSLYYLEHRRALAAVAAVLFGAADRAMPAGRQRRPQADTALYEHRLGAARQLVGAAAWREAWRRGRAMSADDAAKVAIRLLTDLPALPVVSPSTC